MQIVIEIDDDNYATIQEEYKEESMRENGEISNETVNIILDAFYKGTVSSSPCDVCRYRPPSSTDGKPCCMCPAEKGASSDADSN